MRQYSNHITSVFLFIVIACSISCKKLVSVDEPIDSITAEKMFKNQAQAEGALVGIYNAMIHGSRLGPGNYANQAIRNCFAGGLATFAGGLSAGEFNISSTDPNSYALATNRLTLLNDVYSTNFWTSAYNVIYNANSVIEGIANAQGSVMSDSVKKQYTAEAKLLRAFSYFYLVNFFGDLPLALTADFNKTVNVSRTPVANVYAQILKDLEKAEQELPATYGAGKGSRVRVNKWVAKALLARVHLYLKNYEQAAIKASEIIAENSLFELEPLSNIFLTSSREAIFQLMQTNQDPELKNATAEGRYFIPNNPYKDNASAWLSPELLNSFEPGDQRREEWTDSTMQSTTGINVKVWYPTKYKTGNYNSNPGFPSNEYYMVIRLAEMYLIRAEARANGADGGASKAIDDLNAIRLRTSLPLLSTTLDAAAVSQAVVQERSIELFAEWGHRWLDLKRTNKASDVLSNIPLKQPWEGDYQLLYPIPRKEVESNRNLLQNPGYIL